MPALAASVSWMFGEAALLDRFVLVAAAGFRAVEIQAPYSEPASSLAERIQDANLQAVLINTPVALAAVPGEERAFRKGMQHALEYAIALGCEQIHCLAGRTDDPRCRVDLHSQSSLGSRPGCSAWRSTLARAAEYG